MKNINDEIENIEPDENAFYSLLDFSKALEFTLISEGFLHNDTLVDDASILKVRLTTILHSEVGNYFDGTKHYTNTEFIDALKSFNGKSFKDATSKEIKEVLKKANAQKSDSIKKFYNLFHENNGLLNKARTCNSSFGFLSTIVLVPGLIIWLTDFCEKMTEKRSKKDLAAAEKAGNTAQINAAETYLAEHNQPTKTTSMAGFLGRK